MLLDLLRLRTARFRSGEQEGERDMRDKEGDREKKDRGGNTDKWAPPPCGVHVSKTAMQNYWMAKCERF